MRSSCEDKFKLPTSAIRNQIFCYSTRSKVLLSGSSEKVQVNPNSSCPYGVLNVPRNSDFDTVKNAFLKAALVYHPDKESGDSAIFIRIREAFEEISVPKSNNNFQGWMTESEFEEWFQDEVTASDFLTFSIDEETRREIVELHKTMTSGKNDVAEFNDKGGYWEMARQIAERDEVSKRIRSESGEDPVRALLSAGTEESTTKLRRRRRR